MVKIMKKICECKYKDLQVGDYFRIKREKGNGTYCKKEFSFYDVVDHKEYRKLWGGTMCIKVEL